MSVFSHTGSRNVAVAAAQFSYAVLRSHCWNVEVCPKVQDLVKPAVQCQLEPSQPPSLLAFNYMLGNCHGHAITHIKEISDLRLPHPGHQPRQP